MRRTCARQQGDIPRLALAAVLALLVSACSLLSTSETATENGEMTIPADGRAIRTDLQPLSGEQCGHLATTLGQIGVSFTVQSYPFQDQIAGAAGMGCLIQAEAAGQQFTGLQPIADRVKSLMTGGEWAEDTAYAVESSQGIATAFRKDAGLCLFYVGWWPADDVACPQNKPVTECQVAIEKRVYSIMLHCAQ